MVLEALKLACFDIDYTNISGKNILDYYVNDKRMFQTVLFYADNIPDKWMNSRLYRLKGMMPLILLENSLLNSIRNASSSERIAKVAKARGVDIDTYIEMLDKKKRKATLSKTPKRYF